MGTNESLFATISTWPWYLTLLAALMGLIVVLVVLFVLLRVSLGLLGRYRKQREVRSLHQDLMIWSRLSALVRGGKYAQQAKKELSVQLHVIDQCFSAGLKHVHQHRHLGKQQPWVLLVGEPQAGKSSLLRHSALDWRYQRAYEDSSASTASQDAASSTASSTASSAAQAPAPQAAPAAAPQSAPRSSMPLQIVVGPEAVMVEVSGRIFFDAWAEGSGAEFDHIIELIARNHRGRSLPLHEIMLCIPADALLADSAEITQRKAALISDALLQVTTELKMHLPVTVMVTKLDEVLGLREYGAALSDALAMQALGFSLKEDETYTGAQLQDFFSEITQRLQEGVFDLMLSPEVLALNTQGRSRLDKSALIYLFAQNFAALEPQLKFYLNTIFAPDGALPQHKVMLKGVYFCSALDQGVCFNADFAALTQRPIDDALYFDRSVVRAQAEGSELSWAPASTRSYFIKEALLRCLVPQVTAAARYNRRGRYYQQLPWLMGAGVCAALSVIALYGALWQAPQLARALHDDTLYYQSLAQLLAQDVVDEAVLFGLDRSSKPHTYFDEAMPRVSALTRLNFFAQNHLRLKMDEQLPWTFYPWSYIFFAGPHTAMPARYFIYDQVQTKMVYLPLVQTVERYLAWHYQEPYSYQKRNALFALLEIASFNDLNAGSQANQAYNAQIMASFLDYLYPQLGANLQRELSYFMPEYDYYAQATNDLIVFDVFYQQLCERSITDFLQQWQRLSNYPESKYQQLKEQIQHFAALEQRRQALERIGAKYSGLQTVPELIVFNDQVRAWRESLLRSYAQIQPWLPQEVVTVQHQLDSGALAGVKPAVAPTAPTAPATPAPAAVLGQSPKDKVPPNANEHQVSAAVAMALQAQLASAYEQQQQQLKDDLTQLQPMRAALQHTRLMQHAPAESRATVRRADSAQLAQSHAQGARSDLGSANLDQVREQISADLKQDYEQINMLLQQVFAGPLLRLAAPEPNTVQSAGTTQPQTLVARAASAGAAASGAGAPALTAASEARAGVLPRTRAHEDHAYLFEYQVLAQLAQLLTLPQPRTDFATVKDALQALKQLDRTYAQQNHELHSLLQRHEQTQLVQQTKDVWPQLLALQLQEQQIALYQAILAFYPPATKPQTQLADLSLAIGRYPMAEVMSAHNLDSDYLNFLGQVSLRGEFNPHGFAALAEPILLLQEQAAPPQVSAQAAAAPAPTVPAAEQEAPPNFSQEFLRESAQLQSLTQALKSYSRAYLNYWARLADSVEFSAQSYYEFHLASQQFKAYELNAQLQKLYELSLESLEQLPAALLSAAEAKRRDQALSLVQQRLNCFTLDFNEQCASIINAWSMLPYSALQATKQVNSLLAAGHGARLFAVSQPHSELYLPWWDRFTRLGRSLLKSNVHEESALTVNALLAQLNAFPLAADGVPDQALNRAELKNLYQQFKLLGLEQVITASSQTLSLSQAESAATEAAQQALSALGANAAQDTGNNSAELMQPIEPMALTSERLAALSQIGALFAVLVAEPQPQMQVLLLGSSEQHKLKQHLGLPQPLALLRYRYVALEQNQSLNASEKVSSTQSAAADPSTNQAAGSYRLWTTGLDSSDFSLHFYRYSGQAQPTVSLHFDQVYPLLDLYTRGDGWFDQSTNCYYVPLYVQDPMLGTSIYFVGLKSISSEGGKEVPVLPEPQHWPNHSTFAPLL